MNPFQETMYQDLMSLVNSNEAFYYKDFEMDDSVYRIFNYRLASYTNFLERNAVECRGHMFEIKGSEAIRLASLPMEKFWNVGENPFTMELDFSNPMQVMIKEDGSLISTFVHGDIVRCKSKGSIASDQAIAATNYLHKNVGLREDVEALESLGATVNMEYVAPTNRIVIGYEVERLIVLNVRDRHTGKYIPRQNLSSFLALQDHWVPEYSVPDDCDMQEWVQSVENMEGFEGVVIQLHNGQHVKKKTLWYLALHHTKDSINNPRRLFEAVLEDASDDLRTLFADDKVAIQQIEEMEGKVEKLYNHMVDQVERFYERNKHLDRKEYAVLGQRELDRMYFGLAMNKYVGKDVNYTTFLKSKWKQIGIKDESTLTE